MFGIFLSKFCNWQISSCLGSQDKASAVNMHSDEFRVSVQAKNGKAGLKKAIFVLIKDETTYKAIYYIVQLF